MKLVSMFILIGFLLLNACAATSGADIEAKDPWARAGMKDGNSAVYFLLQNPTSEGDELVGASSDAAEAVEIHLSQMAADGVMQMIPQESIGLGPGRQVEFKPGSYHIMFIGLKQDLKAGDEIILALHFKYHADLVLTVPVKDATDMGGSGMDGHMP